ncbi:Uncharacterised protein [Mycobacterium tuberculosis]|nr:Uncharacterised protein [Mycobacterium tuberculosis]CKT38268.1 Uncharacterised protein [Mycobacterium tuberculosis]CKT43012.1 Uncharacterised protein [Mycobacterium tuberculosis]CKU66742.1 Uncharacterised protein [Mycobacterium tuberculosis]COV92321.1 Uncharacterised protein [Mycobacterium tuberculosis]
MGPVTHGCFDAGYHLRGEGSADNRAQPLMARIVEHDHRAEVFG